MGNPAIPPFEGISGFRSAVTEPADGLPDTFRIFHDPADPQAGFAIARNLRVIPAPAMIPGTSPWRPIPAYLP